MRVESVTVALALVLFTQVVEGQPRCQTAYKETVSCKEGNGYRTLKETCIDATVTDTPCLCIGAGTTFRIKCKPGETTSAPPVFNKCEKLVRNYGDCKQWPDGTWHRYIKYICIDGCTCPTSYYVSCTPPT